MGVGSSSLSGVLTPSRCKTIARRGQRNPPGAEEFHAGGYGKTVLALALCHDDRVIDAFDDGVLWTSLGQTPKVVQELSKLYEALTGNYPTVGDERQAATKLAEKLEARNCLLVIDDVWDRAHLEP